MISPVEEEIQKVVNKVEETYEEFIFTSIRPWCEEVTQQRISKSILEKALKEYFKNHPEERR